MSRRGALRAAAVAVALGAVAVLGLAGSSTAASHGDPLAAARAATAPYHSLKAARAAGYTVLFQDRLGLTCITDLGRPSMGGMGYHYVNPAYLGSTDPAHPAALVYRPGPDGRLHLAALEYLVVEPRTDPAPAQFGQAFMFTPAGDVGVNRFMPDAFYSLHVWIWDHNASGRFAMWNPDVHCPA